MTVVINWLMIGTIINLGLESHVNQGPRLESVSPDKATATNKRTEE